jgi:predicted PurR-regulated permease PerM
LLDNLTMVRARGGWLGAYGCGARLRTVIAKASMSIEKDRQVQPALSAEAVDIAIRLGLLALLIFWSWQIVAPFLTILVWSAILAVALYPLFDRLKTWLNRPKLAATVVTLLCLSVVVAPVAWLGYGLVNGAEFVANKLEAGISVPLPSESVKEWPLIGEEIYQFWTRAVADISTQLSKLAPVLKPIAGWQLEVAG